MRTHSMFHVYVLHIYTFHTVANAHLNFTITRTCTASIKGMVAATIGLLSGTIIGWAMVNWGYVNTFNTPIQ